MKKNRMMRLASGLLVAVLVTTSMISGTFAKYTTQDSASDVARVAKWGVELQVVGNLYGDTYKDAIVKEDADGFTVQSVDQTADLVAPGTKNDEGFTFSLKGQPEVAGEVTTTMKIQNVFLKEGTYGVMIPIDSGVVTKANFDEFTSIKYDTKSNNFKVETGLYYKNDGAFYFTKEWKENVDFYTLEDHVKFDTPYYPVVYNLSGSTNNTGKASADSLKLAADKIAANLDLKAGEPENDTSITYTGTKPFEPNYNLADLKVDGLTLTWAWAFGEKEKVGDAADTNDKADTILGLLQNTTEGKEGTVVKRTGEYYMAPQVYTDYCLDTQFSIDITVTQVH